MSTLSPGLFTYAEWAIRMDPDGKTSELVNLQSQHNGILEDCLAQPANHGNAHEFTQVVKLPTPSRRSYNQGIVATMAAVQKQIQTAIEYDDLVKFDKSLAELGGNLSDLRYQEDAMHLEAMGQLVASDLFYANRSTDITQFTGLANVYFTVNSTTSNIAKNVLDCGGTGSNNASIWLITWGAKQFHTIFPKGFPAGMQHIDRGLELAYDTNTPIGTFLAYLTWIQWNIGICVEDWRYCSRAANIDVTTFGGGSAPPLINILVTMCQMLPTQPAGVGPVQTSDAPDKVTVGRSALYMNRTVALALDLQAMNKTNVLLKMEEWMGETVTTFRGIPIRIVDALTITETRVT